MAQRAAQCPIGSLCPRVQRVPAGRLSVRRCQIARCTAGDEQAPETETSSAIAEKLEVPGLPSRKPGRRQADSSDPVATFLTRRFGVAGGVAWLALLSFGVISEQVKTRNEVAREASGARDVEDAAQEQVQTSSGLRYTDLRSGGGELALQRGYLVAAEVRVEDATGAVLFDTKAAGRELAWFYGARPFQGALCPGVEEGIATIRAGGIRKMIIPPALAFPQGARFPSGTVDPDSTLTYTVKITRISMPPS